MPSHDAIVVGGGLAGLTTAFRLQQRGFDVVVFERRETAGGHVRTVQREGWRHEWGPHTFLGSATAQRALVEELGLPIIEAKKAANRRFVWFDGALHELPLAPWKLLSSGIVPRETLLKLAAEPFRTRPPREDATVREFFDEHFGPQLTSRLVDAFLSGVYAGDIDQLGIAGVFPKLYELARSGSIVRGALASAIAGPKKKKDPLKRRGTFTIEGGLGALTAELAKRLGDRVITGVEPTIERRGQTWTVNGHDAPQLVFAAPAWAGATLLEGTSPALAKLLGELDYPPLTVTHLLYRKDKLPRPLDGFGFLSPRNEGLRILGCLWPSAMYDVCPPTHATMVVFTGGAHDRQAIGLDDTELLAVVQRDLARTMQVASAPDDVSIVRHERSVPQYGRGHLAWRAKVESLAAELPGLHLAGNWLDGVSMNDTIARAERVAAALTKPKTEARAA